MSGQRVERQPTKNRGLGGGAELARLECDIKAQVKKIIQGNEQRKRRVANGTASKFDIMAAGVIENALNNSCANIADQDARAEVHKQIYKSITQNMPYESIMGVMCGRRQFYDYRTEFIIMVAEGLGMMPGKRGKGNGNGS